MTNAPQDPSRDPAEQEAAAPETSAPEPPKASPGTSAKAPPAAPPQTPPYPPYGRPAPPPYGRPIPPPPPYRPGKLEKTVLRWKRPARPMPPALLAGTAVAGVIGAVTLGPTLRTGRLGVGVLIAAAAVAYVAGVSAWSAGRLKRGGRLNRTGIGFVLLAVALAGTAAFRDALWIVVPALLLAVAVGSYGTSGGRSWVELLGGGFAVVPAAVRAVPWAARGAHAATAGRRAAWPAIRSALIAAGLLAVFGALFVGADAAFGSLAAGLVPDISPGSVILYGITGGTLLLLASGAAFLGQAPPPLHMLRPEPAEPAGRWSWAVPIAALDLLFLAFCAVQAGVFLADDKDALLRSTGLTYAQYARQGFFQLVVVTVLVLAVVAVARRYAPSATREDRTTVRVLLGLLCALTLVVVAVALRRLYLYEETFGWTRLRLWVHAFELWLGVVVVLVAVAGIAGGRWLPRAVAATGAVAMLALVGINPDAFIADRNVARHEQTGKVDGWYLRRLSADAVPALDRLPEPQRSCALYHIDSWLNREEPAMSANLSRRRARALLERRPVDRTLSCATTSLP